MNQVAAYLHPAEAKTIQQIRRNEVNGVPDRTGSGVTGTAEIAAASMDLLREGTRFTEQDVNWLFEGG